ncbi:pyridoxamine 5'-phosphate oxidase family protein [Ponticoccus sp. SC2-23]|uniref:pyridoxamine 5'-phosphate oxidase family protein n=1 Tax=Alexandriicola marinus TaxID=2081710 RepID=UPI000FDA772E|nr:pyridoxamine 5'-phosphate oxidase family protein [Alexandriicola marinus]MBM1220328.1 pyridoxamine 5'-phosphate oxidase family protein [Ponticoccus sp. SC6-9]MBM1225014.1 pyridoxamine 5'-phosphate oxidase family protein [Ponticoccus sp. SC6-15]MBM1228528.1 pyridoxamine 5'-phosphate oxidase family protein [Ponticoccus sp. SC6-38]MBM1233835.1 pyridoxamine 5'-phosphate oxidase family protein [Ponticoccus sp. SC6-45]MBM1239029.1 pyridoxamine 5'-phosphate oxidase family protein [Ponticoccus sp. 
MRSIMDVSELDAIYGAPSSGAVTKVVDRLNPLYRDWIDAARFCVLTTVGPDGTDGSPRGEDGPVVRIIDDQTLQMPDWRGNNRLDSLRNIVRDGRVSLMLMVPGSSTVVRVNGTARLTADAEITQSFEQNGKHPKTVIVITIGEVYFQCAKAIMRAGLWSRDDSAGLPTAGQFLKERDAGFDAETYDATYPEQARERMW